VTLSQLFVCYTSTSLSGTNHMGTEEYWFLDLPHAAISLASEAANQVAELHTLDW